MITLRPVETDVDVEAWLHVRGITMVASLPLP